MDYTSDGPIHLLVHKTVPQWENDLPTHPGSVHAEKSGMCVV